MNLAHILEKLFGLNISAEKTIPSPQHEDLFWYIADWIASLFI